MIIVGKKLSHSSIKNSCPALHIAATGNGGLVIRVVGPYLNRSEELQRGRGDLDSLREFTAEAIRYAVLDINH